MRRQTICVNTWLHNEPGRSWGDETEALEKRQRQLNELTDMGWELATSVSIPVTEGVVISDTLTRPLP